MKLHRYIVMIIMLIITLEGYSQALDTTIFNGCLGGFTQTGSVNDSTFNFAGLFVNHGNQFNAQDIDITKPENYFIAVEGSGKGYELKVTSFTINGSIVYGVCVDRSGELNFIPSGTAAIYTKTQKRGFPPDITCVSNVLKTYIDNQFRWQVDTISLSATINVDTTYSDGNTLYIVIEGDTSAITFTDLDEQILSVAQPTPDTVEITISNGNTIAIPVGSTTQDTSGRINSLYIQNDTLFIEEEGGTIVNSIKLLTGDTSNVNEIQTLSFGENTLFLNLGDSIISTVNLSLFLDNTDEQSLSLVNDTLSITGDTSIISLSGYLDNTDNQYLTMSNLIQSNRVEIGISNSNKKLIFKEGNNINIGQTDSTIIFNALVETIIDDIYAIDDTLFLVVGGDTTFAIVSTGYNESFLINNDSIYITDAGGTLTVGLPKPDTVNLFTHNLILDTTRNHTLQDSTSFVIAGNKNSLPLIKGVDPTSFVLQDIGLVQIGKHYQDSIAGISDGDIGGLSINQIKLTNSPDRYSSVYRFIARDRHGSMDDGVSLLKDSFPALVYYGLGTDTYDATDIWPAEVFDTTPYFPSWFRVDGNFTTSGTYFKSDASVFIVNSDEIVLRKDIDNAVTATHLLARDTTSTSLSGDFTGRLVEYSIDSLVAKSTQSLTLDTVSANSFTMSIENGNSVTVPLVFRTTNYFVGPNNEGFVMASDTGITYEIDGGTGSRVVDVPEGVQLYRFQTTGTSADLNNNSFFVTFSTADSDLFNTTLSSRFMPDVALYESGTLPNTVDLNVAYGIQSINTVKDNKVMTMYVGNGNLNSISFPAFLIVFDFL